MPPHNQPAPAEDRPAKPWLLEPAARFPEGRDIAWGDPDAAPGQHEIEFSKAISAKRTADALERLADLAELVAAQRLNLGPRS